jgi:hypothetical protein
MTSQRFLACTKLTLASLTAVGIAVGTLASSAAVAAPLEEDDSNYRVDETGKSPLSPNAVEGLLTTAGGDFYGLGFGARYSHTLDGGVFFGAAYTHYLGRTTEIYSVKTSSSADQLMIEGGYEFWWDKIGLRPYAGLGMVWVRASVESAGYMSGAAESMEVSDSAMAFALGAQLTYAMSDSIYVGADGHLFNGFAEGDEASLQFAARLGTSF